MIYVVSRLYSVPSAVTAEQLAAFALDELAPKLSGEAGFIRYVTALTTDGRYGSFSAHTSQNAARFSQKIEAEWIDGHSLLRDTELTEAVEGEVIGSEKGPLEISGGLHAIRALYTTDAAIGEVKQAFEKEARSLIRKVPGLARYTVAHLEDGRIGIFSSFATRENAGTLPVEAKRFHGTRGEEVAGKLIGVYSK
jgi:hypothetical protein